jgi:hypothetical protein
MYMPFFNVGSLRLGRRRRTTKLLANSGENISKTSGGLKADFAGIEWRKIKDFRQPFAGQAAMFMKSGDMSRPNEAH